MAFREVHNIQLGRHLVAAADLKQGQIVLDQRPYAAVLYDGQVPVRCDWCYKTAQPGTTLMRCAHSKFAHYCSRDHQRAAWRAYYRQESAALAACAPQVPPATVRLAARVLWRRNSEHTDSQQCQQQQEQQPAAGHLQQQLAGGTFSDVEALLSHWQDLDDARKLQYAQMAALTREFMEAGCRQQQQQQRSPQSTQQGSAAAATAPDPATHLDVKQIALLLARFACNNHTICDDELRPIGVGIYPLGALINHACRPNCVQTFTGPNIVFRTLRTVPADEQLTISYVELAATRQERRRQLLEQYFFDIDQPPQQQPQPQVDQASQQQPAAPEAAAATGDELLSSMQESGLQRLQLLVQLPTGMSGMQQQQQQQQEVQELLLWTSTCTDHPQQQPGQQQQSGCDGVSGAAGTTGNADDQQAQQHTISTTTNTTSSSSSSSSRTTSSPPWPEDPADHQLCQMLLLKNPDSSSNSKSGHKGSRQQQVLALPGGMCLLPLLHTTHNNQAGPTAAAAEALAGLFQDLEGLGQEMGLAEANESEMSGRKQQVAAMQPQPQLQRQHQQLEAVQWGDWAQVLQAASSSSSAAATGNGQMQQQQQCAAADVVIAAASMLLQVQQLQQQAERLARDGDAAAAVRVCQAALAAADGAGLQGNAQLVAATGSPDRPPATAAAAAAAAAECGVGDGQLTPWGPDTGRGRACRTELARVVLGPQHILRLRVLAGLLVAAVDAAEWPLALQAARQLTPLYECVYPKVWPNLGLHYAMLAKLEMLLEQPGAAARAAEAAAAVLCVTHGGSCGVVHEACRIRYEAEQELAAARMAE